MLCDASRRTHGSERGEINVGKSMYWDLEKGRLAYIHRIRSTGDKRAEGKKEVWKGGKGAMTIAAYVHRIRPIDVMGEDEDGIDRIE